MTAFTSDTVPADAIALRLNTDGTVTPVLDVDGGDPADQRLRLLVVVGEAWNVPPETVFDNGHAEWIGQDGATVHAFAQGEGDVNATTLPAFTATGMDESYLIPSVTVGHNVAFIARDDVDSPSMLPARPLARVIGSAVPGLTVTDPVYLAENLPDGYYGPGQAPPADSLISLLASLGINLDDLDDVDDVDDTDDVPFQVIGADDVRVPFATLDRDDS